ncbi:MAG: endolytic transglycosylase MltG [Acidimicrobiia bacterium]|nr:endolytic transglycosylase MltG [Acidimicrobiia bacterium]
MGAESPPTGSGRVRRVGPDGRPIGPHAPAGAGVSDSPPDMPASDRVARDSGVDLRPSEPAVVEVARPRRARRRYRPLFWILSLVLVAVVVGGVVGGLWFLEQMRPGDSGGEVSLVLPDGMTTGEVVDRLDHEGVLKSATAFRLYLKVRSLGRVAGGEYLFVKNQDFAGVLETLRAGPLVSTQTITYPEGYSIVRMAEATAEVFPGVEAEAYRAAATDGSITSGWQPDGVTSLEGLLFPDTYTLDEEVTAEDVIRRQLERFDEIASETGLGHSTTVTPYEALIVASIIEREVKRPEDRPKVARAIYNRLAKGMKLQIDATVFYGQAPDLPFEQAVENVTSWNTYRIAGLPATPIANPGRESIMAALQPAEGNWLYWVTVDKETGATVFNESYEAHKQAIADARAAGTY